MSFRKLLVPFFICAYVILTLTNPVDGNPVKRFLGRKTVELLNKLYNKIGIITHDLSDALFLVANASERKSKANRIEFLKTDKPFGHKYDGWKWCYNIQCEEKPENTNKDPVVILVGFTYSSNLFKDNNGLTKRLEKRLGRSAKMASWVFGATPAFQLRTIIKHEKSGRIATVLLEGNIGSHIYRLTAKILYFRDSVLMEANPKITKQCLKCGNKKCFAKKNNNMKEYNIKNKK
eukprot:g5107.t1